MGGSVDRIQKAIAPALDYLQHSRLSDVEFLYTPSQIGLATLHLADSVLVDEFLARRYESDPLVYGIEKDALVEIVSEIEDMIRAVGKGEVDLKKVKEVDKRLKGCTNPEKIPGTALSVSSLWSVRETSTDVMAGISEGKGNKRLRSQLQRPSRH